MTLGVDVFLAVTAGVILTLLSTTEIAYGQLSDVALHLLRSAAKSSGQLAFFDDLIGHDERFRTAVRFGIHGSVVFISVLSLRGAQQAGVGHSLITGFFLAIFIVFVCRLVIPRLIAQNDPERVFLAVLPVVRPYYRLVSLPLAPFERVIGVFRKTPEEQAASDEAKLDETISDIQALIDVGEEEGIIAESEGAMIQSIVELGDTSVREIMTTRTQIIAIGSESTILDARDLMVTCKHSRLPVYTDQMDNIDGVMYVRDLIAAWADGKEQERVTTVMRPAYFVPEVKPVADLLEEMRKSQIQIAMVIDEYGTVAGLITIEDLIEEIVGEIEDEDVVNDDDEIIDEGNGSLLVRGATEIRKVELQLDTELMADDFTTVAGLIINELGHLPSRGERLNFKGLELEVVEADNRRVNLVRLRPLQQPEPQSQEATREG